MEQPKSPDRSERKELTFFDEVKQLQYNTTGLHQHLERLKIVAEKEEQIENPRLYQEIDKIVVLSEEVSRKVDRIVLELLRRGEAEV